MNNKENIDTSQKYLKICNLYTPSMIVTITLNPSIDISVIVPQLIPTEKLRCESYEKEVGGGGINVAKGLHRLGMKTKALFFSGGHNGKFIESRLKEEGLVIKPIHLRPETRENITVTDLKDGKEYRLVNKGAGIKKTHELHLLTALNSLRPRPGHLVLSGSHPPGLSDQFAGKLAAWCSRNNCKLVLDLPGEALAKCFGYRPFLIKPSLKEVGQVIGNPGLTKSQSVQVAKEWVSKGFAENIVISMGAEGAIICNGMETYRIKPPPVVTMSTVGAGDSMVAGVLFKLAQQAELLDALRMGIACGTAATLHKGTKLFDPRQATKLYQQLKTMRPINNHG